MKKVILLMMMGLLIAQAQAVYIDAEPGVGGNTVRASDGDPDAWWINATAPDGLWGFRAFGFDQDGVFNGPTKDIYESSGTGSGAEDSVPIIITVSGLTPGEMYQVSVVYWSSDSQNWNVRAGFDLGNMILYDRTGEVGIPGTLIPGYHDGDRDPYSGLVGSIAADGSGEIKVYIDDLSPGTGWYDRSWYDGLEVVPEPATCVLLALGGLMSLRRRR